MDQSDNDSSNSPDPTTIGCLSASRHLVEKENFVRVTQVLIRQLIGKIVGSEFGRWGASSLLQYLDPGLS